MADFDDLLDDLRAEYARLDGVLAGLTDEQWLAGSGAPGWTVRDVMMHLALTEEGVVATLARSSDQWANRELSVDALVDQQVQQTPDGPAETFARWRAASAAAIEALAEADPDEKYQWAAAPLRPRTLATTRLAEHWAHGLDVTEPLGIDLPDTARLRHIAWLGHATIPYGCELAGIEPQPVRAELDAPDGSTWSFGPADAPSCITGDAGMFCRVGAQRLSAAESGLVAEGPFGADALRVLRNYAA